MVDLQNDFLEGGVLGAPNSNSIISTVNRYVTLFGDEKLPVVATRDWHPPDHISFTSRGGIWPPHCVRGTKGAEFSPLLRIPPNTIIISKATEPDVEAYSGFQGTDLRSRLESLLVKDVYVCGIATEYCVKSTVLDALSLGYNTVLLLDAIAPIDDTQGKTAVEEMKRKGCRTSYYDDVSHLMSRA